MQTSGIESLRISIEGPRVDALRLDEILRIRLATLTSIKSRYGVFPGIVNEPGNSTEERREHSEAIGQRDRWGYVMDLIAH
ncbi:MAG: hypothetical protein KJ634_00955 [Gammaproteobacteria bacterium]|nr:hypothetical protein [Gammaproteobacteria bacterium]MBU1414167.1 hypothetical protein [Gammaproteobacteria bacterium]